MCHFIYRGPSSHGELTLSVGDHGAVIHTADKAYIKALSAKPYVDQYGIVRADGSDYCSVAIHGHDRDSTLCALMGTTYVVVLPREEHNRLKEAVWQ